MPTPPQIMALFERDGGGIGGGDPEIPMMNGGNQASLVSFSLLFTPGLRRASIRSFGSNLALHAHCLGGVQKSHWTCAGRFWWRTFGLMAWARWWFQICCYFSPLFWGRIPIWLQSYFSTGLKPPTSERWNICWNLLWRNGSKQTSNLQDAGVRAGWYLASWALKKNLKASYKSRELEFWDWCRYGTPGEQWGNDTKTRKKTRSVPGGLMLHWTLRTSWKPSLTTDPRSLRLAHLADGRWHQKMEIICGYLWHL